MNDRQRHALAFNAITQVLKDAGEFVPLSVREKIAAGVLEALCGDQDSRPGYPAPGSEIPDMPGYVVGTCGHRVARSEWQAGFRTCERCPVLDTEED